MQVREENETPKIECLTEVNNEQIKEGKVCIPEIEFENSFEKEKINSFFNILTQTLTRWERVLSDDENFFVEYKKKILCQFNKENLLYYPLSFRNMVNLVLLCFNLLKKNSYHLGSLPKVLYKKKKKISFHFLIFQFLFFLLEFFIFWIFLENNF